MNCAYDRHGEIWVRQSEAWRWAQRIPQTRIRWPGESHSLKVRRR